MKSEVEINKNKIQVGDVLIYTDSANSDKWTVSELFDGGFEASNEVETQNFLFKDLQIGWEISSKTKKQRVEQAYCEKKTLVYA